LYKIGSNERVLIQLFMRTISASTAGIGTLCVTSTPKLVLAAVFAAALLTGQAAAAEALRLGGTGSAAGMLQQVGAKFTVATGVKVVLTPSLGSTGAIRALTDGLLDIPVPARPLKTAESAAGLRQVAVLRTAHVMATSDSNPNTLKSGDLAGIFAAEKPAWADGTPIRIILRPHSDTALLGELFPGMDKAIEAGRHRAEVPTAATDQDNAALAERTPGLIDRNQHDPAQNREAQPPSRAA
jgi:phosphate transport system substrate-binding protein